MRTEPGLFSLGATLDGIPLVWMALSPVEFSTLSQILRLEEGSSLTMVAPAFSVIVRTRSWLALGALSCVLTACQGAGDGDSKKEKSADSDSKKPSTKDSGEQKSKKKSSGQDTEKGTPEPGEGSKEPSKEEDDWFKEPGECGEGCNILDPDACGDDERCVSWNCSLDPAPSQAWDDSNCRKIGEKEKGEECKRPWESTVKNQCGKGLVCWSRCRETCQGDRENPSCSNKKEACMLSNYGFVAACLTKCDPLKPDCEEDSPACIPNGHLNNAFVCAPGGSKKLGTYGDPCKTLNQCAPGHYCIESRFVDHKSCKGDHCCTEFCDTRKKGKECSQEDAKCTPFYGKASKAPKAYKYVGVCSTL